MIWRAGVHKWVIYGNELKPIDIREDQLEQLRRFLLGETGFPADTYLWVSVSAVVDSPISVAFLPYGGFHDGHYSFRFVIPGIMFALFMGRFVPPIVPPLCSVGSNERLLHLTTNLENAAMQYAMEFMKTTNPSQSLRLIGGEGTSSEII